MQWIIDHRLEFLYIYKTEMQLTLYKEMLSQFQNWIIRKLVFSYRF